MRSFIRQVFRFFLSTCLGLVVDLGLYAVLTAVGVVAGVANVLSSASAVLVMYFVVTRYIFGRERSTRTFLLFICWYIVSIAGFSALIQLGVSRFDLAPLISKLLSLPFSFAANFAFSRVLFNRPAVSA